MSRHKLRYYHALYFEVTYPFVDLIAFLLNQKRYVGIISSEDTMASDINHLELSLKKKHSTALSDDITMESEQ